MDEAPTKSDMVCFMVSHLVYNIVTLVLLSWCTINIAVTITIGKPWE